MRQRKNVRRMNRLYNENSYVYAQVFFIADMKHRPNPSGWHYFTYENEIYRKKVQN